METACMKGDAQVWDCREMMKDIPALRTIWIRRKAVSVLYILRDLLRDRSLRVWLNASSCMNALAPMLLESEAS